MKKLTGWLPALPAVIFLILGAWAYTQETQAQQQVESISRCRTAAPRYVEIDTATTANNELVALVAGQRVYVCGFTLDNDTATTGLQFVYGTGTACATDEVDITGIMTVATLTYPNAGATQFQTAAGTALCLELSTNTQVNGHLTYVQY